MLFMFLLSLAGPLPSTSSAAEIKIQVQPIASEQQLVLTAATLGILVNLNDPNSIELGQRYAEIRGIPADNIIGLKLPNVAYVARHLMVRELDRLRQNPSYHRLAAFVLAFDRPYRVDSNQSITSAISQGISTMRWQGNCNPTARNPDAGKPPGDVMTLKPAMMLTAGGNLADSIALATRGHDADGSDPAARIVFLKTNDSARSGPRESSMKRATEAFGNQVGITLTDKREVWKDLIGFQTGLAVVPALEQFQFLPGAFADHLTSFGGVIEGKNSQMPATTWIKAGATATFGTVREPCNFPAKFPDPRRLVGNYLGGDTIIEAYWKSVSMMTEGLFIGEPLSRPFPPFDVALDGNRLEVRANGRSEAFLKLHSSKRPAKRAESDIELGLFWVDGGRPEWIGDISFSRDLETGTHLAAIELPPTQLTRRQLGVLVRK
jgi:uncharacterized protein (TIGR03790 family)